MSVAATLSQMSCIDIYDPITPGVFDHIYRIGESVFGAKFKDGVYYIVGQGTELEENGKFSLAGWEVDFDCIPKYHAILGNLHSGFDENIDKLISQMTIDIPTGAPIAVGGHSKGAGEGSIMAAKLKLAGYNVAYVVLFACPNSMYQRGANWYATNLPNTLSLRNVSREIPELGDPVPLVPLAPFTGPVKHNLINNPPKGLSALVPTNWHKSALYNEVGLTL